MRIFSLLCRETIKETCQVLVLCIDFFFVVDFTYSLSYLFFIKKNGLAYVCWDCFVNNLLIFSSKCSLISSVFFYFLGGKKRSQFYYDHWNIKYLSKFKWDNLTDEIGISLISVVLYLIMFYSLLCV